MTAVRQTWSTYNRAHLAQHVLFVTASTGALRDKVGLRVMTLRSGPLGGDAQIAAKVVEGRVHAVFFFVDPLSAHPHDPDIRTLLRVCNVHNVPIATNVAAADLLLTSNLMVDSSSDQPATLEKGVLIAQS